MEKYKEIERSIIKTYRKEIWSKFVKAIKEYDLIQDDDKIMVCISGGKDSFLLAKCMEELHRHGKQNFSVCYAVMDPGYTKEARKSIEDNAKLLNLDVHIFPSDIFEVVSSMKDQKPCYLCARMRRGYLYNKAKELGCNKIALGHHFDDVIETTLLSMLYGAEIKTMMPKLHSDNFPGLELIRPMYLVKEEAINMWKKHNDLSFIHCACPLADYYSCDDDDNKRKEVKELISKLKKTNPNVDNNIFTALDNVNLNCVVGTKKNKEYHSFLESYDDEK